MKNTTNFFEQNLRYEIRIAGSGGQGIILAGIMLAEAAILDGKYAVQSQSYGAETRGGNSISEVVLSDTEIDYPRAVELDLLVALTQEACDRNLPDVKAEGLVIVDSDSVHRVLWGKLASLPFSQIARRAGEERAINVAALGAIASFCSSISPESLAKAIAKRLPRAKVAANLQAFDEALKLAHNLRKSLQFIETKNGFEI